MMHIVATVHALAVIIGGVEREREREKEIKNGVMVARPRRVDERGWSCWPIGGR